MKTSIGEFFGGLAIFIVVMTFILGIGFGLYNSSQSERETEERLTELCINQGHTGWDEQVGCFGGTVEPN